MVWLECVGFVLNWPETYRYTAYFLSFIRCSSRSCMPDSHVFSASSSVRANDVSSHHEHVTVSSADKSPSVCLVPHLAPGSHLIKVDFVADGVSDFVLYAGDPRGLGAAGMPCLM